MAQYRLADTLDSLRLPSNPRAVVAREDNTGTVRWRGHNSEVTATVVRLLSEVTMVRD